MNFMQPSWYNMSNFRPLQVMAQNCELMNRYYQAARRTKPDQRDMIAVSWHDATRVGICPTDSELRFGVTLRAYLYNQVHLTSVTRYLFTYYQSVNITEFGSDVFLRNMDLLKLFRAGQGKRKFQSNWHLHFVEWFCKTRIMYPVYLYEELTWLRGDISLHRPRTTILFATF